MANSPKVRKSPALVNTTEEEFDYPSGEGNAAIRYLGEGGVVLKNLWRKFLWLEV
ncbi:UPF0182 family protein [Desulfocastanea catecholica]